MLRAPVWLRLTRRGTLIVAYARKAITDPWTKIGEQTFTGLAQNLMAGLAVSSHVSGTTATATFSQVRIGEWSTDGVNWVRVGEAGPIAMNSTIYIGLAVTSHDRTLNATGVFDDVIVQP